MKIIAGKYPEISNWQDWVKFKYPHGSRLSLVFLRRLGAFAKSVGQAMNNVLGYRPIEETQRLWDADVKANGGKPSGKVSKPGYSWHEHGLAIDLDGTFWQSLMNTMCMNRSRLNQPLLNEYGLCLPLNKIDSNVLEWWHLQPIETAYGILSSERAGFLDTYDVIYGGDDFMDLRDFQTAMKHIGVYTGKVDGLNGPLSKAAADECLPVVLEILGLLDPQKLVEENTALKNDLSTIASIFSIIKKYEK